MDTSQFFLDLTNNIPLKCSTPHPEVQSSSKNIPYTNMNTSVLNFP